jgi:hypothetical protein
VKGRFLSLFAKESGEPGSGTDLFCLRWFASHPISSAEHRCQRIEK